MGFETDLSRRLCQYRPPKGCNPRTFQNPATGKARGRHGNFMGGVREG